MGICDGRIAIVTGAGRGIGREHALELARQGASVVVNDIGAELDGSGGSPSPAREVVGEIEALGGRAVVNGDDVADWDGSARLVQTALDAFGGLDVVVNNAGFVRDRMFVNVAEDEWDAVVRVHLKGHFSVARHAAAHWRDRAKAGEANDARIINTSSGSGLYANPGQANYGAAKSGIASMTLIAAKELARYGVTANAIAPGARTRMTLSVGRPQAEVKPGEFDRRDPANVAPLVVWLGSSESADVTGEVFNVSGGTISRAENWKRGQGQDKGDRWEPSELGPVVRSLIPEPEAAPARGRR